MKIFPTKPSSFLTIIKELLNLQGAAKCNTCTLSYFAHFEATT